MPLFHRLAVAFNRTPWIIHISSHAAKFRAQNLIAANKSLLRITDFFLLLFFSSRSYSYAMINSDSEKLARLHHFSPKKYNNFSTWFCNAVIVVISQTANSIQVLSHLEKENMKQNWKKSNELKKKRKTHTTKLCNYNFTIHCIRYQCYLQQFTGWTFVKYVPFGGRNFSSHKNCYGRTDIDCPMFIVVNSLVYFPSDCPFSIPVYESVRYLSSVCHGKKSHHTITDGDPQHFQWAEHKIQPITNKFVQRLLSDVVAILMHSSSHAKAHHVKYNTILINKWKPYTADFSMVEYLFCSVVFFFVLSFSFSFRFTTPFPFGETAGKK